MKSELIIIDNLEDLLKLKSYLEPFEFMALDTETTGLNRSDVVIGFSVCTEVSRAYYVIMQSWNKDSNQLDIKPYYQEVKAMMSSFSSKKLIGHNFVFDAMMIESNYKVKLIDSLHTDTKVLAHLLDENSKNGLKDVAASLFGEESKDEQKEMKASVIANGGVLTKRQYEMYKADPYVMGKYGAKDALLTYKLFLELVPKLYDQGLEEFFYNDESMPLFKGPTYHLNTVGLQVDLSKLQQLKKTLEAECLEAKDFISKEIAEYIIDKPKFNFESNQQLSWLLFDKLGLEFGNLTKAGKTVCRALGIDKLPYTYAARKTFIWTCKSSVNPKFNNPWKYTVCDKKLLETFSSKYKWIEKLLEYKKKKKILNTYVEGIEERISYGVIQPSFLQTGTTSGRYSSRNPNFQNLPRDDRRVKECIVARPGRVFVSADYSQLEPRVFAYFSRDKRLLASFQTGEDFYSTIGMEVYSKFDCKPLKDGHSDAFGIKYKKLRNLSKTIALASTYGATARQLSPVTGKSIEDTQLDIDNYFERFPSVLDMMLESHKQAKIEGEVKTLFGRPRRMPEAKNITKYYGNIKHADLPYDARNLLNLSVNHRIQGTAASIVNRAMIKFYENCRKAEIDCQIVCQVHDSIIVECNEENAEDCSLLLQDAMENTTRLEGVELEAIPIIGKSLAKV